MGLTTLELDHCVYVGKIPSSSLEVVIFLFYVDSLLITGPNSGAGVVVKHSLQAHFNTEVVGPVQFFLDIHVCREHSNHSIKHHPDEYLWRVLERFGLTRCWQAKTPIFVSHLLFAADTEALSED
jgi:hypothetical protein